MSDQRGKSPWVRHQKVAFRYSPQHEAWLQAVKSGNDRAVREADADWRRMHDKSFGGFPHFARHERSFLDRAA